MTLAQIQESFDGLMAGGAGQAMAPMIALAAGVMLLLFADIATPLRALRPLIFLGSIAASAGFLIRTLGAPLAEPVLRGTLDANATTALWGLVFLAATALSWAFARGYYRGEDARLEGEHDALMLATPVGMMLMVGANDLVVFFVGLELLSLPLYVLAGFRRARHDSVEAGLKYFLLGSFGSALFLFGAALLYTAAGTVSLPGLREALLGFGSASGASTAIALVGVSLIAAATFFKIGVFPFQFWVPDVYQGSPTPVTALMSTGTKAAAIGFLVKVTFLLPTTAAGVVAVLALFSMAAGNLGALAQKDLKRMLAYSGIAHAGTVLLVVTAALTLRDRADFDVEAMATNAALFYMAAYAFTAAGAFGLIALLEADGGRFTRLENLRGLAQSRPGVAAAMALFMLSLGGIPATAGFLGKWMVFSVLVRADLIFVAVVGALLSVVALGYYLRVIVAIYMQPEPEGQLAPSTQRPWSAGLATVACCASVLVLGLLPGLLLDQLP